MSSVTSNINVSIPRSELRVSRRYVRYIYLAGAILLLFRTFQYFPGMPLVTELSYILAFLLLAFVYAGWKLQVWWRFSLFEWYVLVIATLLPFYSGIMAWLEFGQPVVYGVLAERNMILTASVLLLVAAMKRGTIRIPDLGFVLVGLGWFCLLLYIFMDLTLDPSRFSDFGNGFVEGDGVGSGMRFQFHFNLIAFAFFYYAFIGFRRKSLSHYLLAAPFLLIVLMGGHRSLLLSMLAAFAFFVWRWSSVRRLAQFVPFAVISGAVLIGLLYLINASYMNGLYDKFTDAFTVILTGQMTQDNSANARILETVTAIPYIEKHWFLGNGVISHQWHGGFKKVIGVYFYPSDIGVIGVLFEFGLFSLLLFGCQFLFALRFARRISSRQMPPFPLLDATKAFLLFFAIRSLITGEFVYYSNINVFFVAVLACIYYQGLKADALMTGLTGQDGVESPTLRHSSLRDA